MKKTALLLIPVWGILLTGCSSQSSEELESYKKSMTVFYDALSDYNEAINNIDPNAEDAKSQLLGYLDEMNETYKTMSLVEIPEEFSGISEISVEAADYLQMADEFYHQAYDNDFDEESESLASQYYQRANNRAFVMLQVLHGEVPSGEGVTVTTQDTYQFSTVGTSSDE
jgi:hypothetical protein